jgi:hypothetical protein
MTIKETQYWEGWNLGRGGETVLPESKRGNTDFAEGFRDGIMAHEAYCNDELPYGEPIYDESGHDNHYES